MSSALKSTSEGQTLVLTISNPEFRNALGPEVYAAGVEALNAAENSSDIRSVVITGEGLLFCSGTNLQRSVAERRSSSDVQAQSIEGLHNWIDSIRTFPKPVIAAVEGVAADAGFALALACDLVVAASNAVFSISHSHVGLSPEGGISWALTRALPRALVSELLMCGEGIASPRLHQLGAINQVCGAGDTLAVAMQLAERLNALAPHALASVKELMNDACTQTLNQQLDSERDHFVRNLHHVNRNESINTQVQQRKPQFR